MSGTSSFVEMLKQPIIQISKCTVWIEGEATPAPARINWTHRTNSAYQQP
jgi:hypothetical protein